MPGTWTETSTIPGLPKLLQLIRVSMLLKSSR